MSVNSAHKSQNPGMNGSNSGKMAIERHKAIKDQFGLTSTPTRQQRKAFRRLNSKKG